MIYLIIGLTMLFLGLATAALRFYSDYAITDHIRCCAWVFSIVGGFGLTVYGCFQVWL